ncbi:MAG TPA: protein kinase [Vicinamibacteria bacterium]|nr:protein kinase [Vicinamibacteria bacterium]
MDRESLGVYQLERLLGRGGMGSVYLAHDPRLSRPVALKVLSPELASEKGFKERFLAEARACSRLNHPNITTIHEIGEADGMHFIALELVEGETLESILEREGMLGIQRIRELAAAIAGALAHAHERGVVHRDLKPANVMISSLGIPKILDFGLARRVPGFVGSESQTVARLTEAGMIVGTIAYMAPEQALGKPVDARGDVFAFGALLYEMLTGARAFRGVTATQVLDQLLHGEPPPIEQTRSDAPRDLVRIVEKALRKSPDDRYPSMKDVEAAIGRPGNPQGGSSASRGLRAWARFAAAVGLTAVTGLYVFSRDPSLKPDDSIAVMYFENLSDPGDADQTAQMLTQLLTSELSAAPELKVTSRQRLHDVARRLSFGDASVDGQVASEVAEATGVGTMIVGQVAEAGDRLLATVELIDVGTGRLLSSGSAQASSAEDVFVLASSLGEQVRGELARLADLDAHVAGASRDEPTGSVEAYRHYVSGETFLQGRDLESAAEAFQEAVRIDPGFALAQFRLSMTARWLSEGALAHQAARRAAATVDRAPAHLRDVIVANALYQDGAFFQAIPLLEAALERDPDQKESLYILGQIYVHSLRDGNPRRAIELLERLLELDPDFHQVYDRLALSYAFLGDFESARARLAQWDAKHPEKVAGLRSILATFEGQPEEALAFGQTFSWIEGPLFQAAAAMMASRWEVARTFVEQDVDEWRSDHLKAWALRNRAVFHTYLGEFETAADFYRQAGSVGGFRTHEGASGGVPASSLQLFSELLLLAGEVGAAREQAERALAIQPESWRALYYTGRMAVEDGDETGAREYLTTLRLLVHDGAGQIYADALDGEIALATGELERARLLFESASGTSQMLDWASTCSSAGAAIRDGLARTYLALGREGEAMRTLETLLGSGPERIDHPALYAKALHRLGVMKIDRGRSDEGRRLLERLVSLWGHADWELSMVTDARERLSS